MVWPGYIFFGCELIFLLLCLLYGLPALLSLWLFGSLSFLLTNKYACLLACIPVLDFADCVSYLFVSFFSFFSNSSEIYVPTVYKIIMSTFVMRNLHYQDGVKRFELSQYTPESKKDT